MKQKASPYFLYGIHPCTAALTNPERQVEEVVYVSDKILERLPPLPGFLKKRQADKSWFEKTIGPEAVHQGIALRVFPLESVEISDLAPQQSPHQLVVILDQVNDPHNVGAILRTAAAFGARALVMTDRHAPEETGVLAKSASGALELVPMIRYANLAQALQELKEIGFWIYGLAERGDQSLSQTEFSGKVGLILGAEGSGMRSLTQKNCDFLVKLETADQFSTLNVSNAAAIAMHQVFVKFTKGQNA
jgi:23S rRNA (guanosine2251-2'-O)-methyltransferase